MTICIGMSARGGIVIAADAEESDRYFRRSQQKIFPFIGALPVGSNPSGGPTMACAFTGAGDAGYLDAFIADAIRGVDAGSTQREFEEYLSKKILAFHRQHLFPLARITDPPEIQMLVGAHVHWQTCMFVSNGSTLRRALPYAAVGVGAHFALSLISELWTNQSLKETELLAAYVVSSVKENIEGCGKYTAIVSLHDSIVVPGENGGPSHMERPPSLMTHVSAKKIRKWEESFGSRWARRQLEVINELMAEELANDEQPSPMPSFRE